MSSLRLRKALVIRAYNLRETDETLEEQFRKLCRDDVTGQPQLNLDDVKEYLGFNAQAGGSNKYDRLLGGSLTGKDVNFTEFVEFLETGNTPVSSSSLQRNDENDENVNNLHSRSEPCSPTSSARKRADGNSKLRAVRGIPTRSSTGNMSSTTGLSDPSGGDEEVPPISPVNRDGTNATESGEQYPPSPPRDGVEGANGIDLGKMSNRDAALAFARAGADATMQDMGDDGEVDADGAFVLVEGDGMLGDGLDDPAQCESPFSARGASVPCLDLVRASSDDGGLQRSNSSVWRKREVVKQERNVYYTTVDEDGNLQELVETETSQKEILHMESRDTGEFAHRETTLYEQKETFNNEVVNEQRGEEEYVHLKSENDEYEFMDSNMPKSEQPLSPRAGDYDSSPTKAAGGDYYASEGAGTAAGAAGAAPEGVPGLDLSGVDPDNMDEETRAYYEYLREAQAHGAEQIRAAQEAMKAQQEAEEAETAAYMEAMAGMSEEDLAMLRLAQESAEEAALEAAAEEAMGSPRGTTRMATADEAEDDLAKASSLAAEAMQNFASEFAAAAAAATTEAGAGTEADPVEPTSEEKTEVDEPVDFADID